MDRIEPQQLKDWLSQNKKSRDWLAAQCHVSKSTVDGWISAGRNIPPPSLSILKDIMGMKNAIQPRLSLTTFMRAQELADRKSMTLDQWVEWLIESHVDQQMKDGLPLATSIHQPLRVAEEPQADDLRVAHWLDLVGGIAAGAQISTQVVAEPIQVSKDFPADHYALRVFGRSMEPKIKDGSLIVVKVLENAFPRKGTIVVYSDAMGSTLKEFGYRKARAGEEADSMGNVPVLRSINPEFKEVQTMEGGKIDAVFVETL